MPVFRDLGPYRIIRRIGKGGMGDVYLAEDTRKPDTDPSRRVALKVMWHDLENDSPGVLEAEKQGALLQARLNGIEPRVVRVNSYGDLEDCFFIDMEYIEGRDLAELIQAGPVEPLEATRLGIEIADILLRAHTMRFEHESHDSRGVVHGDIKPRNIRMEASGRVRLMDFGIAKALSMTRKLTRNEFGSVSYSSPERLDTGEVNEHSDLWALAVVLYELVAGTPPFPGENTRRIEQLILARSAPRPLPAHTPQPLRDVLAKALAPRVEDRYLSAVHFKKALQEALSKMRAAQVPEDATRRTARPEGIEPDATRRTTVPGVSDASRAFRDDGATAPDDATRRTIQGDPRPFASPGSLDRSVNLAGGTDPAGLAPVGQQLPVANPASVPAVVEQRVVSRGHRRIQLALGGLAVVGALFLGAREASVRRDANTLTARVNARELSCDQAWKEYRALQGKSLIGIGTGGVREPVAYRCKAEAEQVLKRYLSDESRLKKSDWERAHRATQNVLSLSRDQEVEAWERYTQGHIYRIEEKYDEAQAAYDTAASKNTFCDPYVAEMHMYTYAAKVRDPARVQTARDKVIERGCTNLGKRMTIQLADANHNEAEKLFAADRNDDPVDVRRKNLTQVREYLLAAQEGYMVYPTFGEARARLRKIKRRLDEVDGRLEEMRVQEEASRFLEGWAPAAP